MTGPVSPPCVCGHAHALHVPPAGSCTAYTGHCHGYEAARPAQHTCVSDECRTCGAGRPEGPEPPGVTVSFAGQIATIAYAGDLKELAEGMARYFGDNLERFADQRHADCFVQVAVTRGGQSAGHEYRNGRFVTAGRPAYETAAGGAAPAEGGRT